MREESLFKELDRRAAEGLSVQPQHFLAGSLANLVRFLGGNNLAPASDFDPNN